MLRHWDGTAVSCAVRSGQCLKVWLTSSSSPARERNSGEVRTAKAARMSSRRRHASVSDFLYRKADPVRATRLSFLDSSRRRDRCPPARDDLAPTRHGGRTASGAMRRPPYTTARGSPTRVRVQQTSEGATDNSWGTKDRSEGATDKSQGVAGKSEGAT